MAKIKKTLKRSIAGMDEKQQKFSLITSEEVTWYEYLRSQFGSFLNS